MQRSVRVLIALTNADDSSRADDALRIAGNTCSFAADLKSVEQAMGDVDVILTDTEFAGGAFADWLSLWHMPSVLVVDPTYNPDRLAENTIDESSAFIIKDSGQVWMNYIPMLIRKVAAVRESQNRQNSNILHTEHSYMNLLRMVPDIVYVLDGDGCFAYLNDAVSQLGWKPSELIGKHFAEIVHPDDLPEVGRSIVLRRFEGVSTGPESAPKLFDERRSGDRMTRGLDVRLRHRDGIEWTKAAVDAWGEVSSLGVVLPEFQGQGTGTIGLIHDISERREMERKMARELETRDLLLKEMHHRVKNNLQVVSSILSLESDCIEDDRDRIVFQECQTQVQSMALVHEQLYRGPSPEGVDAGGYFARLGEYLMSVHEAQMRGIRLHIETGSLSLPLDTAIPLAIITTELVSNSFKHAFPDKRKGVVSILLHRSDNMYVYAITDDGIGFAAAKAANVQTTRRKGIGTDLIDALASQLGGTIERLDSGGASTIIHFPVKSQD